MAMDLSPERLREAQFAEVWRGYRMEEVRALLDDAADALERLQQRARDADERAAAAERRLVERAADDELSRTLVLAQRTADAARQEAEVEAARLLGDAEERSRSMLAEVEARVVGMEEAMEARARAELGALNNRRAALEADVALLADYVERQRGALADELRQLLSWLDGGGRLDPPPVELTGATAGSIVDGGTVAAASPAPETSPAAGGGGDDESSLDVTKAEEPAAAPDQVVGGDGPEVHRADDEGPVVSEAADGRDPEEPDLVGSRDEDPFLAELRRAVDDPEPLGPRDDEDVWADTGPLFDQDITASGRFRRRRR